MLVLDTKGKADTARESKLNVTTKWRVHRDNKINISQLT